MPQIYGKTKRPLPTRNSDDIQVQPRLSQYGELMSPQIGDGRMWLCDEGSYFRATNATPGTAITHAATAAFSATAALLCLRSTAGASTSRLYPDFIRLIAIGTPTTATSVDIAITIDNTNRYSSGGTAITPVNGNMDSSNATVAALNFGAVVLTAASGSVRQTSRARVKTQAAPCLTAGDEVLISFIGAGADAGMGLTSGAGATRLVCPVGPCVIGGGHSLNLHVWYPAVTVAPTFEFEMGWWER